AFVCKVPQYACFRVKGCMFEYEQPRRSGNLSTWASSSTDIKSHTTLLSLCFFLATLQLQLQLQLIHTIHIYHIPRSATIFSPKPSHYHYCRDSTPLAHTAVMPASAASSISSIVKPKPVSCGESCDCCGCEESCWCVVM
ncbi:hypothetical protein IAQ61_007394, partial [Plenodomus lingam]